MTVRWLRIAHRGASASAPEHTRPAFERALTHGVDMIELDVQLSRDHALVVIHDRDLERTTTGTGKVRERSLAELKSFDTGGWFDPRFAGEPILTLNEVIDVVGTSARLNVEVKAPEEDLPALATTLTRTLRSRGLLDTTIISCFEPAALAVVRARDDAAQLGLLWQRVDFSEAWDWARRLHAVSVHPHWMLVSVDLVHAAHARGLDVFTWTVNDVRIMRALVRQGVNGIISDYPERFARVED